MKILMEYKQFVGLMFLGEALNKYMKRMREDVMMSKENIEWKAIAGMRNGKLGNEDKKI